MNPTGRGSSRVVRVGVGGREGKCRLVVEESREGEHCGKEERHGKFKEKGDFGKGRQLCLIARIGDRRERVVVECRGMVERYGLIRYIGERGRSEGELERIGWFGKVRE